MQNKTVGRPRGEQDTRAQLIKAALSLFSQQGYQQVTTRQIAACAGVNTAMIRYYFVDKAGLFESMLRETIAPLQQLMRQQVSSGIPQHPAQLIALYYRVMAPNPALPVLIFTTLHNPARPEYQIAEKVFKDFVGGMLSSFQQVLSRDGSLKEGVAQRLTQISCISLAVFPFLVPPVLREALGVSYNSDFLTQLAAHQAMLLEQGVLQAGVSSADERVAKGVQTDEV